MNTRFICRSVHYAKKPIRNAIAANMSTSQPTKIREIINEFLDKREARGMETYGVPFDDVDDGRDWTIELIEELLDALAYSAKEINELRQQLKTPFD